MVFGETLWRGSGILCPSVDDWADFGEEIDVDEFETGYEYQWILTAGKLYQVLLFPSKKDSVFGVDQSMS